MTESYQRSMWQLLDFTTKDSGDEYLPEAVCITLQANGRMFVVVLMGPEEMTTAETINALRGSAQFVADAVGAKLGECRRATLEDLTLPIKKEIN